ncbi:hypothetical protein Cob_v004454 [Colletotrichum orbiculare MAFF 240422]|uniref:Uncharacterized protein n=1 Tax=Colletotrichum orbiculare (strain 104-T / ATCC 96160 / CBS 514.97 / LARS 414 / MAFF 240422) TaxID=1213857 RepID=A0A484FYJ5_COLOR|nr:hypothetical protein Cob_v004454 [Colletotrichum orbiculare MAFF 240422]
MLPHDYIVCADLTVFLEDVSSTAICFRLLSCCTCTGRLWTTSATIHLPSDVSRPFHLLNCRRQRRPRLLPRSASFAHPEASRPSSAAAEDSV